MRPPGGRNSGGGATSYHATAPPRPSPRPPQRLASAATRPHRPSATPLIPGTTATNRINPPHLHLLQRLIETGKLPHLLFYGPPGTGKTSTMLAAAKTMYGSRYQVRAG